MLMNSSKDALRDVVHDILKTILFLTVLSTIELEANEHVTLAKG